MAHQVVEDVNRSPCLVCNGWGEFGERTCTMCEGCGCTVGGHDGLCILEEERGERH